MKSAAADQAILRFVGDVGRPERGYDHLPDTQHIPGKNGLLVGLANAWGWMKHGRAHLQTQAKKHELLYRGQVDTRLKMPHAGFALLILFGAGCTGGGGDKDSACGRALHHVAGLMVAGQAGIDLDSPHAERHREQLSRAAGNSFLQRCEQAVAGVTTSLPAARPRPTASRSTRNVIS